MQETIRPLRTSPSGPAPLTNHRTPILADGHSRNSPSRRSRFRDSIVRTSRSPRLKNRRNPELVSGRIDSVSRSGAGVSVQRTAVIVSRSRGDRGCRWKRTQTSPCRPCPSQPNPECMVRTRISRMAWRRRERGETHESEFRGRGRHRSSIPGNRLGWIDVRSPGRLLHRRCCHLDMKSIFVLTIRSTDAFPAGRHQVSTSAMSSRDGGEETSRLA